VAVVGAGVAGLTSAYLLQRRYDVTLYEAQDRLGGHAHTHSLDEFLRQGGYRRYFVIPLVAAVWSCPPADALGYPARYLFEFLDHHGMLRVARLPGWRTVTAGSRTYVERIAKQLTTVAAGVPARTIRRVPGGVDVHDCDGGTRHFARAVVATHPDEALRLLDSPTAAERDARRLPVHLQRGCAAHRCRSAAPGPGGPGVVELPAARLRGYGRERACQLPPEPAAGAGRGD